MTAYAAAAYWMWGWAWIIWSFAITAISSRPWRWMEFGIAALIVGYCNETWRDI